MTCVAKLVITLFWWSYNRAQLNTPNQRFSLTMSSLLVFAAILCQLSLSSGQTRWKLEPSWSKSYLIPLDKPVNFTEAVRECESRNSRLFTPRNQSELEFVFDEFIDRLQFNIVWLGAWNYPNRFTITWFNSTQPVNLSLFRTRK